MIRKKRLLWQIYPSFLLVILLSLTATIWFASRTLKTFVIEHNTSDLETLAHIFEAQFKGLLSPPDMPQIDQLCKKIGEKGKTRITIILPSGQVAGDSDEDPKKMDSHLDRQEVIQAVKGRLGVSTRFSLTQKKDMIYLAVPLRHGADILGVLRTGIPTESVDGAIRNIREKIIVSGIIISILSAIICLLLSRRISGPIEEIKKGAEKGMGTAEKEWEKGMGTGSLYNYLLDSKDEDILCLAQRDAMTQKTDLKNWSLEVIRLCHE